MQELKKRITNNQYTSEDDCVKKLLEIIKITELQSKNATNIATNLITKIRSCKTTNIVQLMMHEFDISKTDGNALMCIAEALGRIPDTSSKNDLISDKISGCNWMSHFQIQNPTIINIISCGLASIDKVIPTKDKVENESSSHFSNNRYLNFLSDGIEESLKIATSLLCGIAMPMVRIVTNMIVKLMCRQFISGESIENAISRAKTHEKKGFRYSYDMLGEAAVTMKDAELYYLSYRSAIDAVGLASSGKGIYDGPGISIKLSALHPRYSAIQHDRVMNELLPKVKSLMILGKKWNIGITIDAEECQRLEVSLDILEYLALDRDLSGWNGMGLAVQAYQKRASFVIDYLIDLAKRSNRRLMVRLVKGAYWDSEIKNAQVYGFKDYPVFTKKIHTDVSYIACAQKLLSEPKLIYPQFATHNAYTCGIVMSIAGKYDSEKYEFQCLYGMGNELYNEVVGIQKMNIPCRIYAPVGTYETLLAYLVRRLLENSANTSFMHQILDNDISIEKLVQNPIEMTKNEISKFQDRKSIPLPMDIYGKQRINSYGMDISNNIEYAEFEEYFNQNKSKTYNIDPAIFGYSYSGNIINVRSPSDFTDIIGSYRYITQDEVEVAIKNAHLHYPQWTNICKNERAEILEKAADALEENRNNFLCLLIREAGKTINNAIAEIREAVDFLRYYALSAKNDLQSDNSGIGPIVCISPWNFPLAIFVGQISAALVTGNTVLAKPAESTTLIAAEMVQLLHKVGIPKYALQLIPGRGSDIGMTLVSDPCVNGVMFTGSTSVAKIIQSKISSRTCANGQPVVFVAETGGQNAMIVDSSALPEQVTNDVIQSAFDSAGQRCSALRILFIQDEIADKIINMVKGAMMELSVGNSYQLSTDIGPVINQSARDTILAHISNMIERGYQVSQYNYPRNGYFVPPTMIEIDKLSVLTKEIFGPVLHVIRYKKSNIESIINNINDTGYGLTFGVHSRIEKNIRYITNKINSGNAYVNRNMIGAVVGVQPFGGHRLSGTGPKAGGPLYIHRLVKNTNNTLYKHIIDEKIESHISTRELRRLYEQHAPNILPILNDIIKKTISCGSMNLKGPTGEINRYKLKPSENILIIADQRDEVMIQLGYVLSIGNSVICIDGGWVHEFFKSIKFDKDLHSKIKIVKRDQLADSNISVAMISCDDNEFRIWNAEIGSWSDRIVKILRPINNQYDIYSLMLESTISINTAATGGNIELLNSTLEDK